MLHCLGNDQSRIQSFPCWHIPNETHKKTPKTQSWIARDEISTSISLLNLCETMIYSSKSRCSSRGKFLHSSIPSYNVDSGQIPYTTIENGKHPMIGLKDHPTMVEFATTHCMMTVEITPFLINIR